MILLYDHPLSPYGQKVKIALREKGVAFETVSPGGLGAGGAAGDFARANPRAEVPTLVDGDVAVFDSTVILEYLEDAHPTPALLPKGAADRARVRTIEEVMDTHFEPINWGLSELRWFKRAEGDQAAAIEAAAGRQLAGFYVWLERQLGEREWFNGESFGWGDLAVIPFLNGSAGQGRPPPAGSKLAAWQARANARPSVAATTAEIAAMARTSGMANVPELLQQGLFTLEYRDPRLAWLMTSAVLHVVLMGLAPGNIRFTPEFG